MSEDLQDAPRRRAGDRLQGVVGRLNNDPVVVAWTRAAMLFGAGLATVGSICIGLLIYIYQSDTGELKDGLRALRQQMGEVAMALAKIEQHGADSDRRLDRLERRRAGIPLLPASEP